MLRTMDKTIIIMDEGDYGLDLPFKFKLNGILPTDTFIFTIKENAYEEEPSFYKEFTRSLSDEENEYVFVLNFTKQESKNLKEGQYFYSVKHYREDELLNTLIEDEKFIVKKVV